jgi:hypothetical protein
VIDDVYLDRVEKALGKADKRVNKTIDPGDYDKLQKALDKSSDEIGHAADS